MGVCHRGGIGGVEWEEMELGVVELEGCSGRGVVGGVEFLEWEGWSGRGGVGGAEV